MAPMGIFRHCPCLRPHDDDVKILDFSHCSLDDVPHNVFTHERTLEELCLDSNQIRDLPRALFHCEGLRSLSLSDNEIQSIPIAVSSLLKLEELNISKNHILQIPDSIKGCKCLKMVEASINPLGPRLPDGFTQLINLQELYLNDTFLEFLPANFGRLARLQIVELRENHLKVLPKSMSRLVELRRLDIGQNDFLEFPDVIGSLPKLTELWCDCNRIISLPSSIGNLKQLSYLDVSNNKIEDIAPEIANCESLSDLTLSSNNLTELPLTIGNLKNLTILRFDDNEIKYLPSSIGNLSSLEELVFNENEVETIPSSIGFLRNLQTLIADSNEISELPIALGSCMQLTILSLAENRLRVLPDEVSRLASLKVLNLNSNLITHLPYSLTKLTQLQALWLSENQHKPLIPLQSDIDPDTGQKVLTCILLPQLPRDTSPKIVSPQQSASNNNNSEPKSVIKFSTDPSKPDIDEDDAQITSRLIRAPTPYPKELKAHARHARNLALKQKDSQSDDTENRNSNTEMVIPVNGGDALHESLHESSKSSHVEIKEAKVSKAPKSPSTQRNRDDGESVVRPNSLPVKSNFPSVHLETNEGKDAFHSNNIQLVASKLSLLLTEEEQVNQEINQEIDTHKQHSHERKASYKSAVTKPSNIMKGPVEAKLMRKVYSEDNDPERGYKSDHELYANERPKSESNICGYSSDRDTVRAHPISTHHSPKKIPPSNGTPKKIELQKERNTSEQMPYECLCPSQESETITNTHAPSLQTQNDVTDAQIVLNHCNSDSMCGAAVTHTETHTESSTQPLSVKTDLSTVQSSINTNDTVSTSSITSLYPSSGSDRGPLSSRPSSFSSTLSQHSSLSPNDTSLGDSQNHPPVLPPKPVNYRASIATQQSGIPPPPFTSNRQRFPPTASSQFIIHKFSHDSYTPQRHTIVSGHTQTPVMKQHQEPVQRAWDSNGVNFIDNSDESSNSSSNSLLNNHQQMSHNNRWLATRSNAHVFPVIIVKNPGLGFSIESGFVPKNMITNTSKGIFVSHVVENGPACTALKVGDQILQVDGIDMQHVTKDIANDIFQSTGTTVSMMVSREKI